MYYKGISLMFIDDFVDDVYLVMGGVGFIGFKFG